VLRRIFGCKGDDLTGDWRKLHNEELNDLYCLPNIRIIKSRRKRWAVHLEWEEVEWIALAKETIRWWALVNAVINLRVA
jgi:hypothetical protein